MKHGKYRRIGNRVYTEYPDCEQVVICINPDEALRVEKLLNDKSEMIRRLACGCLAKDCIKHGSYTSEMLQLFSQIVS